MNFVWAFLVGGLICVVGQLLIDLTKLTPARILVLYVVAGSARWAGTIRWLILQARAPRCRSSASGTCWPRA